MVDDLFQAHLSEIGRAERLIYLETQYFRDVRVARALAARARAVTELAELALIEPPEELRPFGITVMDGPFFSCMPFTTSSANMSELASALVSFICTV